MGQIIIHRGFTQIDLSLATELIFITKAEHRQDINSVDQINISLESELPLDFRIQDSIHHEGKRFKLNLIPRILKEGETRYSYDLIFEGSQYDLIRKKMFNYDAGGFKNTLSFPLTGPIETHLQMLINNANREKAPSDTTWVLGTYPAGTEDKTLNYSNENCLQALQKICDKESGYAIEFEVIEDLLNNRNTLNIKTIGQNLPYTFSYGMGEGLYKLERSLASSGIVTKLFVYGSSENLPTGYRDFSENLRMPASFGDFITNIPLVEAFGIVEEGQIFEDIKPTFEGTITTVNGTLTPSGQTLFSSTSMNFDLNEKKADGSTKYLIAGTPAKISIKKGNLAGYEFEISSYDHATKTFKINPFTDSRNLVFPGTEVGSIFKLAPGDQFTLLDIIMPQSYIDAAELKLKAEGIKAFDEVSKDKVNYKLDLDPLYLQKLGSEDTTFMSVGDYVKVIDVPLNINKSSRIISLTRNLLDLYKYEVEISDTYEVSIVQSIISDLSVLDTTIKEINIKNKEALRAGYQRMELLKDLIFDPDGYFDPGNIKPLSIETNMLSVGARSQQLNLDNVIFTPNNLSDPNALKISGGVLNHYTIDPSAIKSWTLLENNSTGLNPSKAYYIYAKVLRSGNSGSYDVSTEKIKFDSDPTYYNFLLAVLFPVTSGMRFIELMYGTTYINGRTIKTGRISSVDGLTWFDLDTGEIRGKIVFSDADLEQILVGGENLLRLKPDGMLDLEIVNNVYWHTENPYTISADTVNQTSQIATFVLVLKDQDGNYSVKTEKIVELKNGNERISLKFRDILSNYKRAFVQLIDGNDQIIPIEKIKLEYGLIPTSYSPSYLDIEQKIEDFENTVNWYRTTISGNIVATGTVLLGNYETGTNAGITGVGTEDDVFLWAGSTYSDRNMAPIRFYRNGSGYLENVTVKGEITASSGRLGGTNGWYITSTELVNTGQGRIFFGTRNGTGDLTKGVLIGYDVVPNETINSNLWISCSEVNPLKLNFGAIIDVSGGYGNTGIQINVPEGAANNALDITGGNIRILGKLGISGTYQIERWSLEITKGIITKLTFTG